MIRRTGPVLALLIAAALLAGCAGSPDDTAPTVDTTSGTLRGVTTDTTREFLGIRYAQAPTGDLRWADPVPAPTPTGTVDATTAGPSCAQAGAAPGAAATASSSEDCLFLNVTTPKDVRPDERLPVMVWWHGGGYTSGSGAAYDAERLATRGRVMVVTVNYRLGVFGYLSLPGLAGGGDFGLADQILATRWARDNAAAFGGDPHNVTVFGESAGAMSACAMLTSPVAAGLVDKVALSSGSCRLSWPQDGLLPGVPAGTPYLDRAEAEQFGTAQAATLGCAGPDVVGCLRGRTVEELLPISSSFSDVLAYGTPLLPTDPAQALRDGRTPPVPVLSGGNQAEESAFVGGAQKVQPFVTPESYPTLLRSAFGDRADAVAGRYPSSAYPNPATAWATVITDSSWACPTLEGNADLAAHGSPVFGYEFADPTAPDVNGVGSADFTPGAAHATDLPYLFDLTGTNILTPAQQPLADTMVDYWTSFARTGVPTAAGAPEWPRLTGLDGPSLQLAPTTTTVDLAAEHQCGFWSALGR